MNLKSKILILPAAVLTAQILPVICSATNLEDSITFPTWASLGTDYGDWFAGIFNLLLVPAGLAITVMLAVFVIMKLIDAVAHATHR